MAIFTGSELLVQAIFTMVATPAGGGAVYSLKDVSSVGCKFDTPIDHGAFVELPVIYDRPPPREQHVAIISPHFEAGVNSSPFVGFLPGGGIVQMASGILNNSMNLGFAVDPSVFPLGGPGELEYHFILFKFPDGYL